MDTDPDKACPICWETYNKSNKKKVSCVHCGGSACKKCTEENLLQRLSGRYSQPNCSNPECGKLWNNDFLRTNLTQKFYKKLEELREEAAFSDEAGNIFPRYQDYAKRYAKKKKKYGDFSQINEEIKRIDRVLAPMLDRRKKLVQVSAEMKTLRDAREPYDFDLQNPRNRNPHKAAPGIKVCPKEDCRGYLDKNYVCGMCNTEACKKCCSVKEESHRCNPDQIKTVDEIKKISKACPTCGVSIERKEGCFSPDTSILLASGDIIKAKDVGVGMKLVGEDGDVRTVQKIMSGRDTMYRITQNKADEYIVNSLHRLVLKCSADRATCYMPSLKRWQNSWYDYDENKIKTAKFDTEEKAGEHLAALGSSKLIEITVRDYISLSKTVKKHLCGYRSDGYEGNGSGGEIDSYILGLWLGDDYSNGTSSAAGDIEVLQKLVARAASVGCEVVHEDLYRYSLRRHGHGVKSVAGCKCNVQQCKLCCLADPAAISCTKRKTSNWEDQLRKYELLNDKHIPASYLMSSRLSRNSILAGLIDSGGSNSNKGKRIKISQKNFNLVQQIAFLARSLGHRARVSQEPQANIRTPGGKRKDYDPRYIINISGSDIDQIPTVLHRKKCANSSPNKDDLRTSITVTEIGPGRYNGWRVSGNNSLFILSDFTVVSNCPDMWCTQCKKGWNWDTEEVTEGRIVNPEYFDWINKNIDNVIVREDGDTPCGGLPDYHVVRRSYGDDISAAYTRIAHINDHERGAWISKIANIDSYYVGYLAGEVSKKELIKKRLMVKNMERRNREVLSILDTFLSCCIDIFRHLVHRPSKKKGEGGLKNLEKLRIRTNIALRDLGQKYKMQTTSIDEFSKK